MDPQPPAVADAAAGGPVMGWLDGAIVSARQQRLVSTQIRARATRRQADAARRAAAELASDGRRGRSAVTRSLAGADGHRAVPAGSGDHPRDGRRRQCGDGSRLLWIGALGWAVLALATAAGAAADSPIAAVAASIAYAAAALCATGAAWHQRSGIVAMAALAIWAYAVSGLAYTVDGTSLTVAFPTVFDLGLFVFYPLLAAAVIALVRRYIAHRPAALWLDSAALSVAGVAVAASVLLPRLGPDHTSAQAGQFLYVAGDTMLLALLVSVSLLSATREIRVRFWLGGLAALTLADGVVVAAGADGAPPWVSVVGWPLAMLLLAGAASHRPAAARATPSAAALVGVPTVAALLGIASVVRHQSLEVITALGALSLALVVARLAWNLLENSQLVGLLAASAMTDGLTGLANRPLLLDRLEQALARQARWPSHVAVMLVDLDDFKFVNDSLGHTVGDDVLRAVSDRLRQAVRGHDTVARTSSDTRPQDTIARLGGDEFVIVLEGLRDQRDAATVAERILSMLAAPLRVEGRGLRLQASIGVSLAGPGAHIPAKELLRHADAAMYAAKEDGRNRYRFFEAPMQERVDERTQLTQDLRVALRDGQLRLLYQPQVDLVTGQVVRVEALARWEHPSRGLLTPDAFIPIAEASGLIVDLDNWALRTATAQLQAWRSRGLELAVAVNISAARLTEPGLVDVIELALRRSQTPAGMLEIEITETTAAVDDGQCARTLEAVRALGVMTAIDDFGMGYSALSRLQSFPVTTLKIDRSFVSGLQPRDAGDSIVAAMMAMARSLELQVVAEGVETAEHLDALRGLGCPVGQGYLFSRPVAPGDIEVLAGAPVPLPDPLPSGANGAPPDGRLVRSLLAELQRLTGLESTYLTRVDIGDDVQEVVAARNTGELEIAEGLSVSWDGSICRRAVERGLAFTDNVPEALPGSAAGEALGIRSYASAPILDDRGNVVGTLCGASRRSVALGPEVERIMASFAGLIAEARASDARR